MRRLTRKSNDSQRKHDDESVQGENILEVAGEAEDVLTVELCMKKLKGENKTRQHANSQQRGGTVKEHAAWHHGSILGVTWVAELEMDGRQKRRLESRIQEPFPKKLQLFHVFKWPTPPHHNLEKGESILLVSSYSIFHIPNTFYLPFTKTRTVGCNL